MYSPEAAMEAANGNHALIQSLNNYVIDKLKNRQPKGWRFSC